MAHNSFISHTSKMYTIPIIPGFLRKGLCALGEYILSIPIVDNQSCSTKNVISFFIYLMSNFVFSSMPPVRGIVLIVVHIQKKMFLW